LQDPYAVTVPIIDFIEYNQLRHYPNHETGSRGVFDWELNYQQLSRFPIEKKKLLDAFSTPIMTGGIYLISKK